MNILDSTPTTAIEQLGRLLRARIGTKQVIMIASASHGEGTSTVTAQLAICLAKHGTGSVLAGDLNLDGPQLHEFLNVTNHGGMVDVLNRKTKLTEAVQATKLYNLLVLTSGQRLWDPMTQRDARSDGMPGSNMDRSVERHSTSISSITASRHGASDSLRFRSPLNLSDCQSAFSDMREQFDLTLLDTPPINTFPEGLALTPWVDGVVLVVRAGHTRREVVQHAAEQIRLHGGKILGVVLNRRRYVIPNFLYRRL